MDCHCWPAALARTQLGQRGLSLNTASLWVDELTLATGLGGSAECGGIKAIGQIKKGAMPPFFARYWVGWLGACPIGCALLGKGYGTFFCVIGAEHFLLKGNLHFPELVFFNAH